MGGKILIHPVCWARRPHMAKRKEATHGQASSEDVRSGQFGLLRARAFTLTECANYFIAAGYSST
jgi:hypothetical protein